MKRLYVAAAAGLSLTLLAASSESTVYMFQGGADGGSPFGGLTLGGDGNLYGTTLDGSPTQNYGTVFRVTTSGQETVLYAFLGGNDGANPQAGVMPGFNGDVMFGTTTSGGGSWPSCSGGCGTVYELTPQGSGYQERVIYAFHGPDGMTPIGPLSMGAGGVLYGTTSQGGTNCGPPSTGCGTVFELTPSGSSYTERTLYQFKGGSDGSGPRGRLLIAGTPGNPLIYGTTAQGGIPTCSGGCGTVFQLSTTGESIIYRFKGGTSDGYAPRSGLFLRLDGTLIGFTSLGGIGPGPGSGYSGNGVVYALTKSFTGYAEHIVYFFNGIAGRDGYDPTDENGPVADESGNLYGTTVAGGAGSCNCGTVFKLTPSGSGYVETVLHSFVGSDGQYPHAAPIPYLNSGTWYGTTFGSLVNVGSCNGAGCGVVYKVTP